MHDRSAPIHRDTYKGNQMKRRLLSAWLIFALACPAFAQEAPVPRKMPRTPVNRESLQEQRRNAIPTSREVQGQAIIIDGEKLRIGDIDMRLFGVVPPQLSASFGPQARATLDELTVSQNTTCMIRDRDREERFLATCHNASNADLALELLRHGLAVTARGSVTSTDLAETYVAAEQAATAQKIGLWSVSVPTAAMVSDVPKTNVPTVSTPTSVAISEKKPDEKTTPQADKYDKNQQVKITEAVPIKVMAAPAPALTESVGDATPSKIGFLARYQLLVTGLIMLVTALGLLGAIAIQRLRDRRAEMQAIAAALRGELMAAHAVCRARLRVSTNTEDKDVTWPRLRSTLYQAYVGRIGWLGAELARRIASIYGQASDYAAYYAGDDEGRATTMPKRHALQALIQHIDDVLPRLAIIEHTGNPSSPGVKPPRPVAVVVPLTPNINPASQSPAQETTGAPATLAQNYRALSFDTTRMAMTNVWGAVQKLARKPWEKKQAQSLRDPIAEYTALIEEEMKRFSFVDEEDESTDPQPPGDPASAAWSVKANEAL